MHPITFGDLWFGDHVAPHGPAHLTDSSTHQERAKTSFRSESRLNLKGFQCSQGIFLNPFGRKPDTPRQSTPRDPQVCAGYVAITRIILL
jgi:hypothetical protein